MEGQEEWFEPGGIAMVVLAKMMVVGALIALSWASYVRFFAHPATTAVGWPQEQLNAAFVFAGLACFFWLGGKLLIFLGRKMRERGIKLP